MYIEPQYELLCHSQNNYEVDVDFKLFGLKFCPP